MEDRHFFSSEKGMENLNHETYLADLALREKIILEAQRARAEAMLRFVVVPLAGMIARLVGRATRPGVSGDTSKVEALDATRA
jgi:hypothetical protein